MNEIRDACTNTYQNYDQCTDIRRTGAVRLLLYALITAQRVGTNKLYTPSETANKIYRSKQRITYPLKFLYALAGTHILAYIHTHCRCMYMRQYYHIANPDDRLSSVKAHVILVKRNSAFLVCDRLKL